jgi:DNA-binding GntR family transcriptional regulator
MPLPQKVSPINRPTIRDEVYNQLLSWILEGVLRPGEKLTDHKLADSLGVSRTPVREALKRLEDKGLIEIAANRWTRVAGISLDEAALIYPVIASLEKLALAQAYANLGPAELTRMERLNHELKQAIQNSDPVMASQADAAFHAVIIEQAQNHYISSILTDLKIQHRRLEVQYFQDGFHALASVEEHQRIIESLRDGDLVGAQEIIQANWDKSLKRLHQAGQDKTQEQPE